LSNLNDQSNSVPLKEYLLTIFAFEGEMTDREMVFVNLRFELAERALRLDHGEMLRRLDLLNHAQEDAHQKEASFVGREVYESQVKDGNKWRDEVHSARSNRQGKASVTSGLAGASRVQGRNGKSHRRRGRVFECFHMGEGEVGTTSHDRAERYVSRYPTSSLQFSSVFFTKAIN
jgi:hypothetical protein